MEAEVAAEAAVAVAAAAAAEEAAVAEAVDITAHLGGTASTANQLSRSASRSPLG